MAVPDPRSVDQPDTSALERATVHGLRSRGYLVIEPGGHEDYAYIRCARQVLVDLAETMSEPLVLVGVRPEPGGGFEIMLRRPSRAELQAQVMARFQSAAERKARS